MIALSVAPVNKPTGIYHHLSCYFQMTSSSAQRKTDGHKRHQWCNRKFCYNRKNVTYKKYWRKAVQLYKISNQYKNTVKFISQGTYSTHTATHIKKWQMGSYDLWSSRNHDVLNWNTIIGYDHSSVLCRALDLRWASKVVSRPVANDSGVWHNTRAESPILGHRKSRHCAREQSSHGSGHRCNVSELMSAEWTIGCFHHLWNATQDFKFIKKLFVEDTLNWEP